jgi:hypothetical protein
MASETDPTPNADTTSKSWRAEPREFKETTLDSDVQTLDSEVDLPNLMI